MKLPRLRLAHQLSLLITAAVVLAVVVVGTLSALNLRSGFRDYLQLRDDEQLMRVVALVEQRSANDPQLDWLRNNPQAMRGLMDEFNGRAPRELRGPRRPPPLARDRLETDDAVDPPDPPDAPGQPPRQVGPNHRPPPPAANDRLGDRLLVRDLQGQQIAGRPHPTMLPRTVRAIKVHGVEVGYAELIHEPVPEGSDARFLKVQTNRLWGAALGTIAAAVLAAWWVAGRWSRPLVALQRATRDIARGRGAQPLVPSGATEIAQLVDDVNHMGQSLERLEKARRMWIAQISHELRTPLSVLRGEMEAIEDGARQPTPEVMKRLQGEVLQLSRLVNDLHTVSVADMGRLPCTRTEGDAHAGLWRIAQHYQVQAQQKGLVLTLPPQDAAPIAAQWDFGRITQLLSNLLGNSLRYTDAPGTVAVGWRSDGATLTLTVQDSNPGVSAQDLPELFEPLFRADRARQRRTSSGLRNDAEFADGHGSGLGLSIVRAIAQAHQGSVHACASPTGGLCITVRLPLQHTEGRA